MSSFSTSLTGLGVVSFKKHYSHLSGCVVVVVLICISVIANGIEHLFMCLSSFEVSSHLILIYLLSCLTKFLKTGLLWYNRHTITWTYLSIQLDKF